ncbi:MAG: discoidin domain-containing protein [Verrucomicrobiota bacterium]
MKIYRSIFKFIGLALFGLNLGAVSGSADTTWSGPETISGVQGATAVVSADFNGDNLPDVAVFEGGKGNNDQQYLHWLEAPNWTTHQLHGTLLGRFTGSAAAADFDGDGNVDVVVPEDNHGGGDGRLYLYLNPGPASVTGPWTRHEIYLLTDCFHQNDMAVGDLDGDGKLDVVVRAKSKNGAKRLVVALQNAPDNWTTRYWALPNSTRDQEKSEGVAIGDLTGDGNPEIVLSGVYWENANGWRTGEPTEHVIDNAFADEEIKAVVADLNGDGDNDIFMTSAEGTEVYAAVYLNDGTPGNGAWPKTILKDNFGKCHMIGAADFDGNGTTDLIAGRAFNKKGVYVWYNDGAANFTENPINTDQGFYNAAIIDLDGDNDLDLVGVKGYSNGNPIHIYRNQLDGSAPSNQAPSVEAGSDQTEALGTAVNLNGVVTDDLLPAGSTVTTLWSLQSGPGGVTFGQASSPQTTAEFSAEGAYVLELSADDGDLTASDTVTITIVPDGGGGSLNAAQDRPVTTSKPVNEANLTDGDYSNGSRWFSNSFADDGLQWVEVDLGAAQTVSSAVLAQNTERTDDWRVEVWNGSGWTEVASGTGNTELNVTASFAAVSTDKLRFTVTAGSSYLKVYELEVYAAGSGGGDNQAPSVIAGPDATVEVGQVLALTGIVTDDGLPAGGSLTTLWTVTSGPGNVVFSDVTDPNATATFDAEGNYVLRLTADDSELNAFHELGVTVTSDGSEPTNVALNAAVTASKLDSVAKLTDGVIANSSRWYSNTFADDGPQWIEVTLGGEQTVSSVVLRQNAERTDDWHVEIWNGTTWQQVAAGANNTDMDVTAAFSPVATDRVRLTVTAGVSFLKIYEIEVYSTGGSPGQNQAPVVAAGPDVSVEAGQALTLAGSASDDGLPGGSLATVWSVTSGPAGVAFTDETDPGTAALFTDAGAYVLRLIADDSELSAFDEVGVTVTSGGGSVNLALGAPATASDPVNTANLTDGDLTNSGRWFSNFFAEDGPQWMEVDLGGAQSVAGVVLRQNTERADDWHVEIWNGSAWVQVDSGTGNTELDVTASFAPVSAERVRFTVTAGSSYLKIYELEVYGP